MCGRCAQRFEEAYGRGFEEGVAATIRQALVIHDGE